MYLIVIAWLYVVLLMAFAEATSPVGSWLGGIISFVAYGLLPISLVLYVFGRRPKVKSSETPLHTPDAGGEASAASAVAPVREEP